MNPVCEKAMEELKANLATAQEQRAALQQALDAANARADKAIADKVWHEKKHAEAVNDIDRIASANTSLMNRLVLVREFLDALQLNHRTIEKIQTVSGYGKEVGNQIISAKLEASPDTFGTPEADHIRIIRNADGRHAHIPEWLFQAIRNLEAKVEAFQSATLRDMPIKPLPALDPERYSTYVANLDAWGQEGWLTANLLKAELRTLAPIALIPSPERNFLVDVYAECCRARKKHPGNHDRYIAFTCEVGEVLVEWQKLTSNRGNWSDLQKELCQAASCAMRLYIESDRDLEPKSTGEAKR